MTVLRDGAAIQRKPRDRQTAGWRPALWSGHFIPAKSEKPLIGALP